MLDIAGGVLLALIAYRALAIGLRLSVRRVLDYQSARSLHIRRSWSGADSRVYRLALALGVDTRSVRS